MRTILVAVLVIGWCSFFQPRVWADWSSYDQQHALIVVGKESKDYLIARRVQDAMALHNQCVKAGFDVERVHLFAHGEAAGDRKEVDGEPTLAAVDNALAQIVKASGPRDLVVIVLIGEGTKDHFALPGDKLTYEALANKTRSIKARQVFIAIAADESGGAIKALARPGVCIATATDEKSPRKFAWSRHLPIAFAGGGYTEPSDGNDDGEVTFGEAVRWSAAMSVKVAPKQNPMYAEAGGKAVVASADKSLSSSDPTAPGFLAYRFTLEHENRTLERAYLDYLVDRAGKPVDELSKSLKVDVTACEPATVDKAVAALTAHLDKEKVTYLASSAYAKGARQYLDYLVLRRGKSHSDLTRDLGKNFGRDDWDTMAWCTLKLRAELKRYGLSHHSRAEFEANHAAYLDYLVARSGRKKADIAKAYDLTLDDSKDSAAIITAIRMLEQELTNAMKSYDPRPQWELKQ